MRINEIRKLMGGSVSDRVLFYNLVRFKRPYAGHKNSLITQNK
jgi:hypothetical protein